MPTLADAARLLAAAGPRRLAPLARTLGFAEPLSLPRDARDALRLPPGLRAVQVAARGAGVRLLLAELTGDEPSREVLRRAAARLATHAPQHLWCLLGARAVPAETLVGVVQPGGALALLAVRRDDVRDADAQALAAMAAAGAGTGSGTGVDDALVHARWAELAGREALTARFYAALERAVIGLAGGLAPSVPPADARALAITAASRLLFLSFLETKGWLDGDRAFLTRAFDACAASGGGFHRRVLIPLWFGTLNTPASRRARAATGFGRIPFLNGGLFARTPLERVHRHRHLPDDAVGALFTDVLARYRFTAREAVGGVREAAVDPEMLGLAFESLMAADERKASGAFYTPPALVQHVAHEGLALALERGTVPDGAVAAALRDDPLPRGVARALATAAAAITVCDPACGSGAFLVAILETLARLRAAEGPRDGGTDGGADADARLRRDIVARQLFGVDRNPTAVWLCELRLWLSVVVAHDEPDPRRVPALPNLDRNIRFGDALGPFAGSAAPVGRAVQGLRVRYARASGGRKRTLARALDAAERQVAVAAATTRIAAVAARRTELLRLARGRDLFGARRGLSADERRRLDAWRAEQRALVRERAGLRAGAALPFAFDVHFAASVPPGFDLVLGNPPWVRPHHLPPAEREGLRGRFTVLRDAAWAAGATAGGAGPGFGGQVDLAAVFTERAAQLLRPGGTLAFVLPVKLWRSLAGGGWRRLFDGPLSLRRLEDWSEGPPTFDAAVYPAIVVARRRADAGAAAHDPQPARVVTVRRDTAVMWDLAQDRRALDAGPGSPWVVAPPLVHAAFDAVRAVGVPMAATPFGRPTLGVKSGCNDAYVVLRELEEASRVRVRAGVRAMPIHARWVRPLVRGETCDRWRLPPSREAIVFPHDDAGPLPALPPDLSAWLGPWRRRLVGRADAKGRRARPWWSLYRTDGARGDRARVVWSDFGRTPRALVLPAGSPVVPLNTCYVVHAASDDDALALTALLNSPVLGGWLAIIAEPARGGWRRFLGWTMALAPVPADWPRARTLLAPLARAAMAGHPPDDETLCRATTAAFGLRMRDVAPLLEWTA